MSPENPKPPAVNIFDCATSSFQKGETITDTFKMLTSYSMGQTVFIVRSKIEGVQRWLEIALNEYASLNGISAPSIVNAGDGRHEHPTQELLDETSVLFTAPHTPRAVVAPSGSARYGRPGMCPSVVSLMR